MSEVVSLCRTSSECPSQVLSRRNLYGLISGSKCNYKVHIRVKGNKIHV